MLPQKLPLAQMATTWAEQLNPIIANPTVNNLILKNVKLISGTNVINHKLGRTLQGWNSVRVRANATIYDQQDNNQTPQLTLVLVASAPVVVDLVVF